MQIGWLCAIGNTGLSYQPQGRWRTEHTNCSLLNKKWRASKSFLCSVNLFSSPIGSLNVLQKLLAVQSHLVKPIYEVFQYFYHLKHTSTIRFHSDKYLKKRLFLSNKSPEKFGTKNHCPCCLHSKLAIVMLYYEKY